MKHFSLFLSTLLLFACSPSAQQASDSDEKTAIPLAEEGKQASLPPDLWTSTHFLIADFNGDTHMDTAKTVIIDKKKGIMIIHGEAKQVFLLGAGNDFGNGGDDFAWMDQWELFTESTVMESIYNEKDDSFEQKEISLANTAFFIGQQEGAGAVIAWKDGQYQWIRQGD